MIKLICSDVEGVLVDSQRFWMKLHEVYGTLEEGELLTQMYVRTDHQKLVDKVCGRLWKGKPHQPYIDLVNSIPYNRGIQQFFLEADKFSVDGQRVPRLLISGGSYEVCERIKRDFGIDFIFSNQLIFKNGYATGEFRWPVGHGGPTKVRIIEQVCEDLEILPAEVLMVGDRDNDIDAFRFVGISIAFNTTSEALKKEATYVVESNNLHDLAKVLENIRTETGSSPSAHGPGEGP